MLLPIILFILFNPQDPSLYDPSNPNHPKAYDGSDGDVVAGEELVAKEKKLREEIDLKVERIIQDRKNSAEANQTQVEGYSEAPPVRGSQAPAVIQEAQDNAAPENELSSSVVPLAQDSAAPENGLSSPVDPLAQDSSAPKEEDAVDPTGEGKPAPEPVPVAQDDVPAFPQARATKSSFR